MPAVINIPYNQQLTAVGGTAPYVFSLKAGSPPPGISMDANGLLTGTPTVLGTFNFTVQAIDGFNGYGERAYALEVISGNTLNDEMTSLAPFLDYPADELSGNYVSVGSSPLEIAPDPPNDPWRRAPGLIRSAPAQYSFMAPYPQGTSAWANPTLDDSDLPAQSGWTTGAFNAFVLRFGQGQGAEWTFCGITYRSSISVTPTNSIRFQVDGNGRLYFLVRASNSGGLGSLAMRVETADGVIEDGERYMVSAVQRADGVGVRLYVNGVEVAVTRTLGTSTTINSWVDDIFASVTIPSLFSVNGAPSGITSSFGFVEEGVCLVQRPAVWRNNPPSDTEIADLFAAAAFSNPITDYYEYLLNEYVHTQDAFYLQVGWVNGAGTTDWGINVQVGGHGRMDFPSPQTLNQLETLRTSMYPNYRSQLNGGQYTATGGASELNDETQGTVSIVFELPASIAIGTSRPLWTWGEGISGPDENIGAALVGNALGTSLTFTIGSFTSSGSTTGDFWRLTVTAADAQMALAEFPDAFVMITFTQDGTGLRCFINGVEVSGVVSSVGTTYDENGWFEQLVSPANFNFSIGYPSSTTKVNDMWVHEVMVLDQRALTPAEVLAHWNAMNGSF